MKLKLIKVELPPHLMKKIIDAKSSRHDLYHVPLEHPLFLSVCDAEEPFQKDEGYGRHMSITLRHMESGERVRLPSEEEEQAVLNALKIDPNNFDRDVQTTGMINYWEKQ